MFGIRLFLVKQALHKIKSRANYHNLRVSRILFNQKTRKFNQPLAGFTYQTVEVCGMKSEWIAYNKNNHTNKVILYFHGGGYVTGSIETHRSFCSQLSKHSGAKLLLIEYRLAPENVYPAPIEDAANAYKWLLAQGYEAKNIAFAGDSAGGGVTAGTLAYLRDNEIELPACAVMFSPWLDLTFSGKSYQENQEIDPMLIYDGFVLWSKAYLGNAERNAPYASPLLHSLKKFPPTLIQVGSCEMLLDDSTQFAAKAKTEGVEVTLEIYDKHFHVFNAFWRVLPQARKANKIAGAFMAKHLNISAAKSGE
ncbi:MAG: alpha/beta hydrolase [Chitinophagales bacterium]|jgi:monoterpene epsilon-lactone hydrolase|nr:alpha/beta hydrolase [Chitinophagales bacterium]OJV28277.1 MAG: hypothetical protein BGO32_05430 [Bacteroidetes bacterium 37-13]HRN94833.1 alpha/beta hydrolase [Chitinophagales bacterium]HRP38740.1 alpha/beta hydrolase [Chitinophagales bacterium]